MTRQLADNKILWVAWKLFLGFATAGIVCIIYFNTGEWTKDRSIDLMTSWDRAIPLMPWTWWLYFPGYIGSLLVAVTTIRDIKIYYRILVTILVFQVFATITYFAIPSTFPRPEALIQHDWSSRALIWYWSFDPPNNTLPSGHVALSTLCALSMWEDKNPVRYLVYFMTLCVVVTVHTTKQHYWVDTVAGLAMAWGCWYGVRRFWLNRQQKKAGRDSGALET